MVENKIKALDIYKIANKKNLNVKKIVIIVFLFLEIIGFIKIAKKELEIIKQQKDFEQYEIQANLLIQQEEEKKAKIEREKQKLLEEKKPKLTNERKREYSKYL